jgi:hypothetical protein
MNKNLNEISKTTNLKFQNDYLSRIEATPLPSVSKEGKHNLDKISISESGKKIFSKSALGYNGDSIEVND